MLFNAVRDPMLCGLKDKPSKISVLYVLQEALHVVDATSDVARVDSGKGVCGPSVPAEL